MALTPKLRKLLALSATLATAVTLALSGVVAGIGALYDPSAMPNPNWVPALGLHLYLASPLFAAAATVMIVAPGMAVLWRMDPGPSGWPSLVVRGFLASYLLRFVAHSAVKLAVGSMSALAFWLVEGCLVAVVLWALLGTKDTGSEGRPAASQRTASGEGAEAPEPSATTASGVEQLGLLVAVPAVAAILLAPMLFWQDLNGDGVETLYMGWAMSDFVLPRFVGGSGFLGLGAGMTAMAPPVGWFVQMLGPSEAAARMVLLVYLPVVAFAVIALAEHASDGLSRIQRSAVLVMLVAFTTVLVYSATYSDYVPDAAAPAGLELLTLLCLSGMVLCLWEGRRTAFLAFVAVGFMARPTALMLVGLMVVATLVVLRGPERARMLRDLGWALAVCAGLLVLFEKVLLAQLGEGDPGYPSGSMVERYQYLRFTDVRRIAWAAVPGGIVGFVGLFALRAHDRYSRQLAIVLLLYFLAFFVPAFVALHHFVPVMALPLAVYLRTWKTSKAAYVAVAGAAVGVALVWPQTFDVQRPNRELGSRIEFRGLDLLEATAQHRSSQRLLDGASLLFPPSWDVADAAEERIDGGLAFAYYGATAPRGAREIDYVVAFETEAEPPGFVRVGERDGIVAYVRSEATWARDRTTAPSTRFGAPLFRVDRATSFEFIGARDGAYDLNLRDMPVIWRLFPGG